MNVLGIDVSTKALDLCLLDENDNRAHWEHLPLPKLEPKQRVELVRAVQDAMPQPAWYEDNGVYLIAVEQPYGPQRQAIAALNLVLGAVIASLPGELPCWLLTSAEWKAGIKIKGSTSTQPGTFGQKLLALWAAIHGGSSDWPTDANVALACAYTAREMNAKAVADGLEELAETFAEELPRPASHDRGAA